MTERDRQRDGQRDGSIAASSGARPALFVDRDGTLVVDVGYPRDPARVEPLPGAVTALRALAADFALVIISNQSGIGRGLIREAEARAVHDRVIELFAQQGVWFAGAYYCPHAPEAGCVCRKPAPGLLFDATHELGLDLAASVMIGDKASDVAAGLAAGCRHVVRFGPDGDGDAGDAHRPNGHRVGTSERFGPDGDDGDAGVQRCADWAAVARLLGSLAS
jgi:histidinol-phosphate phosphatase family protein